MKKLKTLITLCAITVIASCGSTEPQKYSLDDVDNQLTMNDFSYIDMPLKKLNALEVLPNDLIADVSKSKRKLALRAQMDNVDNTVLGAVVQDTSLPAMVLIDSLMSENLLGNVSLNPMMIGSLLFTETRKKKSYETGHLFFIGDENCNEEMCAKKAYKEFLDEYISEYLAMINVGIPEEQHFKLDKPLTDVFSKKGQAYYIVSGEVKIRILNFHNIGGKFIDGQYVVGTFGEDAGLTFDLHARSDMYDKNLSYLIDMTKRHPNMTVYQNKTNVTDYSATQNKYVLRKECYGRSMIEKGHVYVLSMFNCNTFANPDGVPSTLAFSIH